MVLHNVPHHTRTLIKIPPVLDADILCYGYLYVIDVMVVPEVFENRVRKRKKSMFWTGSLLR